jgi:hypothetical protein
MIRSNFNWLRVVAGIFITCLITANIIAIKLVNNWGLIVPAAVVIFPLNCFYVGKRSVFSANGQITWHSRVPVSFVTVTDTQKNYTLG